MAISQPTALGASGSTANESNQSIHYLSEAIMKKQPLTVQSIFLAAENITLFNQVLAIAKEDDS